jgi:tRNA threonylcarbamoyladenosine biosynthesis protein TsaB
MILFINTVGRDEIVVGLRLDQKIIDQKKVSAARMQAEKLLPLIEAVLKKNKLKLFDIKEIEVENFGGSFTSLRIGVATANALGFALGIPVKGTVGLAKKVGDISIVEPVYDREADIGITHNA